MPELDHLFLPATPEQARILSDFGLTEGYRRTHYSQGTANVCFCFSNAFLELLTITEEEMIQRTEVAPLRLYDRLTNASGTCPFGVCLRYADGSPVFDDYHYPLADLPPGARIDIAEANAVEPLWFSFAPTMRPDLRPEASRPPLTHPIGFQEITRVTIESPAGMPHSPASVLALASKPPVRFAEASRYKIVLGFDDEQSGHRHDFAPHLPLAFCW